MIICLCNAMTDGDVRDAIANGAARPKEVYACCGGRAQCGNCTLTVLRILREGAGQKPA
jgi:bacterioferritin-associated ferredoxin